MATLNLAAIKPTWKGTYDNSTAYAVDDIVNYNDAGKLGTYICITASTGNAPSTAGTIHASWNLQTKQSTVWDGNVAMGTAGQALKVNSTGTGFEFGSAGESTTIEAKTADYTILPADVNGKAEYILGCAATGANRVITLPSLAAVTGNTIITIFANADTTVTSGIGQHEIQVNQDAGDNSGAEIWSGTVKSDFVRLCKIGSAWQIIDHKESYWEKRYLGSNQTIDGYNHEHLTSGGWNVYQNSTGNGNIDGNSWGNCWNTSNNEFICPFDCWADMNMAIFPTEANDHGLTCSWRVNSDTIYYQHHNQDDNRIMGPDGTVRIVQACTSGWDIEPWCRNNDDNGCNTYGGYSGATTQLYIRAWRRYS